MINNDLGINIDKFKEYVQQIDKDYNIHFCDNSIYLDYKDFNVAKYVIDDDFLCSYYLDGKAVKKIVSNDIVRLFYIYIKQHLKPKKYTIQVVETDCNNGYLRINRKCGLIGLGIKKDNEVYKTHFTMSEIETLKQNKEIHIDWYGAIFKEVK